MLIKFFGAGAEKNCSTNGIPDKDILAWIEKQDGKINPYTGTSFKYNNHTWGMCARDNGVEILFDGELKAFLSLEKSFIYPVHPQPTIAPKSELETNKEKVEPKFHKGEWIIHQGTENIYQVVAVIDNHYQLKYGDNYTIQKCADVDRDARLWDITKDAKDGDVLSYVTDEENLWIMIYWSLYKPYEGHVHYHALLVNDNFADKGTCCICIDNLKPATKEQRDLLFAKMKEAGYEWDSEKKELKKISA